MTEITMPKLSDTMTEGTFVAWRKNVGDRVERGEILAEVETDKANMELESFSSGTLLETRVATGDTVPVGAVIAVVGEPGEKTTPSREEHAEEPPPPPGPAPDEPAKEAALRKETGLGALGEGVTAAAEPGAKREVTPPSEAAPPGREPAEQHHDMAEAGDVPERVMEAPEPAPAEKASPLVRRIAREEGVDLAEVAATGPEGRILREDLERYLADRVRSEEPSPYSAPPAGEDRVPVSRMRGAIAKKVVETWQTTPHFAVTVEIDMGEAEALRRGLREAGHPVSVTDFVVKGCAAALHLHPEVNASFAAGGIVRHPTVDIGIAVALEEGLVIPVIRGCHRLPLLRIAAESRRLAEKARAGKIAGDDLRGGTFTVSNLGMYGVDEFFAVINSPEAAILAVGAVADRPVVRDGALAVGRTMRATLSADHRLLDGAVAAKFLAELKGILESPASLLL